MDFDANFEAAQIFEQTDQKLALKFYETGLNIIRHHLKSEEPFKFMAQWPSCFEDPTKHMEVTSKRVPPEILCNYGVLLLSEEGRQQEAMDSLQEALKESERLLSQVDKDDTRIKALVLTLKFNITRCHEKTSRIGEASDMYKKIIAEEPRYIDAYLRLAYLARGRGDMRRALEYLDTAKAK